MKFVIALFLILLQFGCGPSYLSLVNDIQAGNTEKIRSYLEHGGDVNQTGPMFGSLLAIAVEFNQLEIVKLLIDRGAQVEPQDPNVERPFCMLIKNGSGPTAEQIFKVLLNHGAKFNKRCQTNVSNFIGLIKNKMWRSATLLIKKVKAPLGGEFLEIVIQALNEDASGAPVPFLNKYLKEAASYDQAQVGAIFLSIIFAPRLDLLDAFRDFGATFINGSYRNPAQPTDFINAQDLLQWMNTNARGTYAQRAEIERKLNEFMLVKGNPSAMPADFGIKPADWDQIDPVLNDDGAEAWKKASVKEINWWDPPVAGNLTHKKRIQDFCGEIIAIYKPKKLDGGINAKLSRLLHPDKVEAVLADIFDAKLANELSALQEQDKTPEKILAIKKNNAEQLKFASKTMAARWNLVQSCYIHVTGGK